MSLAIDEQTRRELSPYGFDEALLARFAERARGTTPDDNAVRGLVTPPGPDDVTTLPAAGTADRARLAELLSAKDEKNAITATLFFNVAHYALRPWPWILIALATMIVFPNVSDIASKFPNMDPGFVKDDLAFSAMLSYLPAGLMGIVIAALIAA